VSRAGTVLILAALLALGAALLVYGFLHQP